jgi:hypothetical protein
MVRKVSVLTADGRTIELRIRSRRRVAVRADQLLSPMPKKMYLMCNGAKIELRLAWDKPTHGFYVYYVLAEDYCILTSALEKAHKVAPCILYTGHV